MIQEELIRLFDKYIQSCKDKYDVEGQVEGIREARLAQFAQALAGKAQQLLWYAKGNKTIDLHLFTTQLSLMTDEAITGMKKQVENQLRS